MTNRPSSSAIAAAAAITVVTLALGWWAFDLLTMLIFTAGFAGGLLLWLMSPNRGSWIDIRVAFWVALAIFVVHRVEEKEMDFFDFLSRVTGTPKPSSTSIPVILLVIVSVGAWLLIPTLMRRNQPLGYYLAWTFFASMGVTELAHFAVFPWLNPDGPMEYVPGMASVVALAPVGWWGMWRLSFTRVKKTPSRQSDSDL